MLDADRSGHIDAAELQRGLCYKWITIGSVKEIMKKAGQKLDGTIDFNTFSDIGQMRGGHIGQMRNAHTTIKDANREHRISNIYSAKVIGDLRGVEYNNTSLLPTVTHGLNRVNFTNHIYQNICDAQNQKRKTSTIRMKPNGSSGPCLYRKASGHNFT